MLGAAHGGIAERTTAMAEQDAKQQTEPGQQHAEAKQPADAEFSEEQLDQVAGGVMHSMPADDGGE
jgi:hypothetical protein